MLYPSPTLNMPSASTTSLEERTCACLRYFSGVCDSLWEYKKFYVVESSVSGIMSTRTPHKRTREFSPAARSRVYERAEAPKRSKGAHKNVFGRSSGKVQSTAGSLGQGARSLPTFDKASPVVAASPASFLFTFTSALRHELDTIQVPPVFSAVQEGVGQPAHTVDEDIEEVLFNHPRSGKVCCIQHDMAQSDPAPGSERDDAGLDGAMRHSLS